MNRAKIICLAACLSLCLFQSQTTYAAETTEGAAETIAKEEEFYTDDSSIFYDFAEEIEESGGLYQLSDVSYEVIAQAQRSVKVDTYPEKEIQQDGQELVLVGFEEIPEVISDRSMEAETELVSADPEDQIEYTATDPDSGEEVTGQLQLTNQETVGEEWVADLELELTFVHYEALYYEFAGIQIPHNDSQPAFNGQEDVILDHEGLSRATNRIESVRWSGETYTNNAGILCRNALATGSRLITNYRCTYAGAIPLPDLTHITYNATYEFVQPAAYHVIATATYSKAVPPPQETVPVQEETGVVSIPQIVTIGAVGVIAAVVLSVAIYLLATKKKKKEKGKVNHN